MFTLSKKREREAMNAGIDFGTLIPSNRKSMDVRAKQRLFMNVAFKS
jgi:hypothetical protein